MSATFVDYNSTVSRGDNKLLYLDKNIDTIFDLHKKQIEEEETKMYSYKQYDVLLRYMAFEYCLNLFFLVLSELEEETIEDSEAKLKELYLFKEAQINLAHKGIDLDEIYEDIKINYTPVTYNN